MCHPDNFQTDDIERLRWANEYTILLNEAYRTLTDQTLRSVHDAQLARSSHSPLETTHQAGTSSTTSQKKRQFSTSELRERRMVQSAIIAVCVPALVLWVGISILPIFYDDGQARIILLWSMSISMFISAILAVINYHGKYWNW